MRYARQILLARRTARRRAESYLLSMGCARRTNTTSYDVFAIGGRHVETVTSTPVQPPPERGPVMFFPLDTDFEWRTSAKGNHVLICGSSHRATVFFNGYSWCIIINGSPFNSIVADEYFEDEDEAQWRAEAIVAGRAEGATLKPLRPRS
jgi:hypothetical protein